MKRICHGPLECGSNVLQTKGNYSTFKCAPRGCKSSLVTILFLDLNLVISRKSIHEGKDFMSGTCIDNLIDEQCGEIVFGTCPIEVAKVCANADGTLFLIYGNRI